MIRWIIKNVLGTAARMELSKCAMDNSYILDIRDIVDKSGNNIEIVREKIEEGVKFLRKGKTVIICCDYGISRSNALASGVYSVYSNIDYFDALRIIIERTNESDIKFPLIKTVYDALGLNNKNEDACCERRILITGGSGIIGSDLIPILKEKYKIFAPTSNELNVLNHFAKLGLYVLENKITHIIHLANPRKYTSNIALGQTLTMLRNILDICREQDIKLFYPSGWEVYSGYKDCKVSMNEESEVLPEGPYGETKMLCENLINFYRKHYKLKCSIIRSCPLYKEFSQRPKFLFSFIDSAKQNQEIRVHEFLNGSPYVELMHSTDFVNAFIKIIDLELYEDFNAGSGQFFSTYEIAKSIRDKIHSKSIISKTRIDDESPNVRMDYTKLTKVTGWTPKIALQEGIEKLLLS